MSTRRQPSLLESLTLSNFSLVSIATSRLFHIGLIFVIAIVAGRLAWNRFGPQITASDRYRLSAPRIEVTPQPDWIETDVKAAAIRDGGLADLSLLDADIWQKVTDAFRVQTWVAHVERVSKSASGIQVAVVYRQPVAMVEIRDGEIAKLLPVDATGVILNGLEFSGAKAQNYLRIAVHQPDVHGLVEGTVWNDERIVMACRIAEVLSGYRDVIELSHIVCHNATIDRVDHQPSYYLTRVDGSQIIWGNAPGHERPGEASASEKVAQLAMFFSQNESGSGSPRPRQLDIRSGVATPIGQPSATALPTAYRNPPNP